MERRAVDSVARSSPRARYSPALALPRTYKLKGWPGEQVVGQVGSPGFPGELEGGLDSRVEQTTITTSFVKLEIPDANKSDWLTINCKANRA